MGSSASSVASGINIELNEAQPFVAGQDVTGSVMFSNKFKKSITLQRIYVELVGDVVYTAEQYNGSGYYHVTEYDPIFEQLIDLHENQGDFILDRDYYSWPVLFSLPTGLPPSLNQLFTNGPFIRYKIRVVFERAEKYKMNVHRSFPILVNARPLLHPCPSFFPLEAENKNRSDVTLRAILDDRNGSLAPGDSFVLDIELYNPKHLIIKSLPIDLMQHRAIGVGGHCSLTIPLVDMPHLREFSGEHYHEKLELEIPADDSVIPSFYYMPPSLSGQPIVVEYMLKLEVKVHGFFTNFVLNVPVVINSREAYIEVYMEKEAPPSYDSVVEKQ